VVITGANANDYHHAGGRNHSRRKIPTLVRQHRTPAITLRSASPTLDRARVIELPTGTIVSFNRGSVSEITPDISIATKNFSKTTSRRNRAFLKSDPETLSYSNATPTPPTASRTACHCSVTASKILKGAFSAAAIFLRSGKSERPDHAVSESAESATI